MKAVILHGLYMHGIVMMPLAKRLHGYGFDTEVLSYNSVSISEKSLFESIDKSLDPYGQNILIGHSLGGILIKRYLASRKPSIDTISHVVALGSPINGSSIARKLSDVGASLVLGNAIEHGLIEDDTQWHFPQKLFSIAGRLPIGIRPILIRDGEESDGTVTVNETKIDGMFKHQVIDSSHTSIIYSKLTAELIKKFVIE
ncbi:esterase/lipase family protein [Vibrio parahaemolyticus]